MLQQRSRSSATEPPTEASDLTPAPPPTPAPDPDDDAEGAEGRRSRLSSLRRPRRRTVILGGVAALLVVALVVYLTVLRPRAAAGDATAPTTITAQVSTATFEQTVTTTGTLTPAVQEDVSFAASGRVLSVDVAAGDTVEEGQTLATIDTLRLDADLASARADLAEAEADLADAQCADDGSDAATAHVDAAEAAVAVARQAADDAEDAMSDATLVAPAAGLVTAVDVAVGDTVGDSSASSGSSGTTGGSTPGATTSGGSGGTGSGSSGSGSTGTTSAAAFTIVGTDAWSVAVSVGEADVTTISEGDQVEMTSDDLAATVFGTVSEVGRLPSTTQGAVAYPVTITVTGSPEGLFDGVGVDVSIVTERRTDVLAVPAAAVSTDDAGRSVVTVVGADGSTSEQVVETGDSSGSTVEVVSGLAEGDTVSYTAFTPRGGQSGDGESRQGGLPEGFDPSQLPEGFDPSQLPEGGGFPGGQGGGQGGFPGGTS